jgi:putrescine transport system ATP-binding protein
MTLATRIAVMDHGRICQIGTPTEIYEFPRSRFVADFIGSTNLFEGTVKAARKGLVEVECPAAGCAFEAADPRPLAAGRQVWVAVRPEKIAIDRTRPRGARANAVEGRVLDLGYFGKDSLYRVRLATGTLVRVSRPNERRLAEEERSVDWDDRVWLTWQPRSVILLED